MSKKEKKQWEIIKQARSNLLKWSFENQINIVAIHFVPQVGSLETYIFYEIDDEVVKYEQNGISNAVKGVFTNQLIELGYMEEFPKLISFIYDSDENVKNNYQGNYFLRLR